MDDVDVVEDFERAWLKPLAPRAVEGTQCGVHEAKWNGAARELARQGEPGGSRACDKDLG